MFPVILLCSYCVVIVAASMAGGLLPKLMRLTHTRMQVMMSLVGGLMLGVALLHLIPHSLAMTNSIDQTTGGALIGLLFMFALIRILHVHQHGALEDDAGIDGHGHAHCDHDHDHEHHHEPSPGALPVVNPYEPPDSRLSLRESSAAFAERKATLGHDHAHQHSPGVAYSWVGLAFGLALHTLIDGMALGATVASEALLHAGDKDPHFHLLGLGTFLAVALHKPLDAMSITTVMHAGQWSNRAIGWINFAFALMCPLGAALFYFGVDTLGDSQALVVGSALGFAGGVFLCISLADILPEVSFHSHDRFKLTAALLAGVLLAYGIGFLEPKHAHEGHSHAGEHRHSH